MINLIIIAAIAVLAYMFGKFKRKKFVLPEWEENIRLAFKSARLHSMDHEHFDFESELNVLEEIALKETQKEIDRLRK